MRKLTECRTQIRKMYLEDKLSTVGIAKVLNTSCGVIGFHLKCMGVQLRSRSEAGKLKMQLGRGKPPPPLSGIHSPHWKGGRFKITSGYIFVKKPDHHRATFHGYVREHILVWEEANGRELPIGWSIHHINGKRDDNRPENLLAMPKRNHTSGLLIKAVQKQLREVERKLKCANQQGSLIP